MEAVTARASIPAIGRASTRRHEPPAVSPVLSDDEIGRLAISITVGTTALALLGLLVAALHPLSHPLPGDSSREVGLIALAGLPVLVVALRDPHLFARHLPLVAFGGVCSLTLDAWYIGPTFAPFVTMSYIWLGLMSFVFLPRDRAALVVVAIGGAYALVLHHQVDNPASVTQWCLTVAAVAVTGTLGAALVDSVRESAVAEHELRATVEARRGELETASRQKSAFLAAMSHELRTPLNAIIGFAGMLGDGLRGELNAKQQEYVGDICASGDHLTALIGEVLDVDDVEAGRDPLLLTSIDVRRLLASCVGLFREHMAREGVQIKLLVEPGVDVVVGDERKIRQIVLNLLSNAEKFTPTGGRVLVRATMTDRGLRIGVLDSGPGIERQDHERIFEEFRQGRSRALGSGTGLGLPISRRFARLHGGDLTVDSDAGRGTAFWLDLPPDSRSVERVRPARQPRTTAVFEKSELRVTPRRTVELMGSAVLFLLLPIALISVPRPLPEGLQPGWLSIVVGATVLGRLLILLLPNASMATRVFIFSTMGALAVTVAAGFVGPRLAPFVTMFYVWIATNAIAYLSPRAALLQLALVAACYATLLAVQEGHTLPFVRWELTIGMVALAALIVRRVVDRLWDSAEDERLAREEVQGMNAELELAYRHKTEFLANMSHELRTPLNVIIGFADVLASEAFGPLTPDQASDVADILGAARHLLSLIDDVLALGKLEAGRMDVVMAPVVVGGLVASATADATAAAAARGVEWSTNVSDADTSIVIAEAAMLRSIRSLSLVAVDATPEGGSCQLVASRRGGVLEIAAIDGGIVLSIQDRRTLLDEMVGATPGHDTQQALRLALVQRFAALLDGSLDVVADPSGTGNRWVLSVPVSDVGSVLVGDQSLLQ